MFRISPPRLLGLRPFSRTAALLQGCGPSARLRPFRRAAALMRGCKLRTLVQQCRNLSNMFLKMAQTRLRPCCRILFRCCSVVVLMFPTVCPLCSDVAPLLFQYGSIVFRLCSKFVPMPFRLCFDVLPILRCCGDQKTQSRNGIRSDAKRSCLVCRRAWQIARKINTHFR